jgi:hypothetical protein
MAIKLEKLIFFHNFTMLRKLPTQILTIVPSKLLQGEISQTSLEEIPRVKKIHKPRPGEACHSLSEKVKSVFYNVYCNEYKY